jgi:hypothetical protein
MVKTSKTAVRAGRERSMDCALTFLRLRQSHNGRQAWFGGGWDGATPFGPPAEIYEFWNKLVGLAFHTAP